MSFIPQVGDEIDPSLADGYHVFFEREVPVEVRASEDRDAGAGSIEAIRFKVLTMGPPNQPASVRVELSGESDIYFLYIHEMNESAFREVQEAQRLTWAFESYPALLVKMLLYCIEGPHEYSALLSLQRNFQARLDIIQNMEYKVVDLLSIRFGAAPEDLVKHHVVFRYNSLKHRLGVLQSHCNELNGVIRARNPSLLLNLGKTAGSNGAANRQAGGPLPPGVSASQANISFASTRGR